MTYMYVPGKFSMIFQNEIRIKHIVVTLCISMSRLPNWCEKLASNQFICLSHINVREIHLRSRRIKKCVSFCIILCQPLSHRRNQQHFFQLGCRLTRSVETLYWAVYGYSPPYYADVVVSEHYIQEGNKTVAVNNYHHLTEKVGHTIFAVYYITGIIIMVNMLIAMMSTSFSNVQVNQTLTLVLLLCPDIYGVKDLLDQ